MGYIRYVNQIHVYDCTRSRLDFAKGLRAEHLQMVFCHFLDRYCLDNNVKISILCEARKPEHHCVATIYDDNLQYWKAGEVGMLQVWPVDFGAYLDRADVEQDAFLIDLIESSLTRLAGQLHVTADPIAEAIEKLKRAAFPYEWEYFARSNAKRSLRAHMFYSVTRDNESWRVEIRGRKGKIVQSRNVLQNSSFFDAETAVYDATFDNDTLRICNILGDTVAVIPPDA